MGTGGEAAAGRLLKAGRRVAVVERELIGGECAYWACIPSKTLLRGPEARAAAGRGADGGGPAAGAGAGQVLRAKPRASARPTPKAGCRRPGSRSAAGGGR